MMPVHPLHLVIITKIYNIYNDKDKDSYYYNDNDNIKNNIKIITSNDSNLNANKDKIIWRKTRPWNNLTLSDSHKTLSN